MNKEKLHNIKENGFKVPEGYFDSLEDNIMSELKLKDQVNTSGYTTPDNYFEALEDSILDKVSEEKDTKVINIFSRRNIIYASAVAAAIVLLFNLSIFGESEEWDIDNETVENYILDEGITSYEIASLLDEEELTEEDFIDYTDEENYIEDYIIDDLNVEDLY